ncbi:MAG: shikimate kinase, partial [Gaiellaceae bacterium]
MGAGKSTIGQEVAGLSGRPFVDLDREIERRHGSVAELFERGEAEFRRIEEQLAEEVLASSTPAVIAFGGGAVLSEQTRELLRTRAFTVWVDVDVGHAWQRVRDSGRPLARDETQFRRLFDERQPLYEEVSAGLVDSAEDVLLEALQIDVGRGLLAGLGTRLGE